MHKNVTVLCLTHMPTHSMPKYKIIGNMKENLQLLLAWFLI